jgi:hypothetical protein
LKLKDDVDYRSIRSSFSGQLIVRAKKMSEHSHPNSAAQRNAGSLTIKAFAQSQGRKVVFFQGSNRDLRSGDDVYRTWYWSKDATVRPKPMPELDPERSLLAMVDTDYYPDMRKILLDTPCPVVLYTFSPETPSGSVGEISWSMDPDGVYHVDVSGGGHYTHPVWSYSHDTLDVKHPWLNLYKIFQVDRIRCDEFHELVLLNPIAQWNSLEGRYLAEETIESPCFLKRLKPIVFGKQYSWVVLQRQTTEGMKVCISQTNSYLCCEIPAIMYDQLRQLSLSYKNALTVSSVKSHLEKADLTLEQSSVITLYLLDTDMHPLTVRHDPTPGLRVFQRKIAYDQEAKPMLRTFMDPIVDAAYCPVNTRAAEENAVQGRVLAPQRSINCQLTPFLIQAMDEFIEELFPDPGHLFPLSVDEVYERQARPSQRQILQRAETTEYDHATFSSFIKREAYGKVTDERLITTLPGPLKRDYSRYLYAIADHLKEQYWYAFGKPPCRIAELVAVTCENASTAGMTDFTRMDGHVSKILRYLEVKLLTRAFKQDYVPEVLRLHEMQLNAKCYTTHGVKYNVGTARGSGSPETSAFNSVATAFISFLARRMTKVDGHFIAPAAAYQNIGMVGGDDGLIPDINVRKFTRAASMVGQIVKIELIKRGELGVNFLSRYYGPNVWYGDPNSMCDLKRQLAKFHTMVGLAEPAVKALQKARSYYLTDANTPIIGPLCKMLIKELDEDYGDRADQHERWWDRYDREVQFPNDHEPWMNDIFRQQMPDFNKSAFDRWRKDPDRYLFGPPLCYTDPPPTTDDVVVTVAGRDE